MRLSRVFLPHTLTSCSEIELDEATQHYLCKVLRMRVGFSLIVFDGNGGEFDATLSSVNKKSATLAIGAFRDVNPESALNIRLLLCISRGDHMDFAIQKAVELGVTEITPMFSEHGVAALPADRLEQRLAHWQNIIINSCQQCGRTRPPLLNKPAAIGEALTQCTTADELKLVLDPQAESGLKSLPPPRGLVSVLIGAEGGLSQTEIATSTELGFVRIKLGPRVLRTETAATAIMTALQLLWGDLND